MDLRVKGRRPIGLPTAVPAPPAPFRPALALNTTFIRRAARARPGHNVPIADFLPGTYGLRSLVRGLGTGAT